MATSSTAVLESEVRERLADAVTETTENRGQLIVKAPAARRNDVLRVLKEMGFTFYSFCAAVDWPDENRFEVLDHVYSIARRQRVTVKYDIPRDNPRIATATEVYGGANWHERETWEMFGVHFEGHPHLARLLLPDWFEGFPMRKDYILPARVEKPWPGEFFEG